MDTAAAMRQVRRRTRELERILQRHPQADPQVIWQTLILLEQSPIERLRGGLRRGRVFDFR